jgi:hypothetical protein
MENPTRIAGPPRITRRPRGEYYCPANARIRRKWRYRQRHADDTDGKHAAKGSGVAADSLGSLRSNKPDANAGASPSHAEGEASGDAACRSGGGFCKE